MEGSKLNEEMRMHLGQSFEMKDKKLPAKKDEKPVSERSDEETLKIFRTVIDKSKETIPPTIVVNPEAKPRSTGPRNPASTESGEK